VDLKSGALIWKENFGEGKLVELFPFRGKGYLGKSLYKACSLQKSSLLKESQYKKQKTKNQKPKTKNQNLLYRSKAIYRP